MSFFGWFGGDNKEEAPKPKAEPKPPANDGGGGFFSPITNFFGWGGGQQPAATPAAPQGPTATPTQGPTQNPTQTPAQTDPAGNPVTPQTAGPQEKPVDPKMVREAANNMFKAMDGWGTDEDALLGALRGKSAAEIAAIKAEYADHFGRDLDSDIKGELGGKDLEEANAALAADPVQTAVAALDNAANGGLFGMGTDEAKINSVLEGIKDPEQRKAVVKAYQEKTGTSLDSMLKSELSGNDLNLSEALLEGDSTKANAVRLDEAMNGGFLGMGLGTDEEAVYKAIEGCKDETERKALAAAYEKKTGEKLTAALGREFSGAEKDVADSLMEGNAAAANAARVKVASEDFWGTDEEAIFKQMEGKSKDERDALMAAYNAKYGGKNGQNFDEMLKSEMGGNDLEKATQLKDSGKLSDEFALKYATDGLGTNEELIKKTLEGKTKDEIDALKKTYKEKYGKDLDSIISSEVSGRDGFEIGQLMKGKPTTPQEMIDRANEAYEFDRGSGSNWFSNGATDFLTGSNSGAVLDRQHERINKLAAEAKANGGQFTDEQKAQLGTLTEYQGMDVKNYQAAKDSATNALATGAAVVVGAAVSIASAGTLSAPVVAALSALIGGASSMAVKGVMLEGGYALEDIGIDAITTLASAASAGLIKLPGLDGALNKMVGIADPTKATVLQSFLKGGISGTIKGGIDSTVGGLLNEQNYQGDFGDWLKGMGGQVGQGMAGGFLSGGVGAGIGTAMGPGPQVNGNPSYAFSALKGGVSGMGGAAAANLLNPAAYTGRPEDIAKQWLTTVGQAGVSGALDSVAETRGEIKKANAAKAKAAEQAQQQQADEGPTTKPTEPEADPATQKKDAPKPENPTDPNDVSDVKAKVDAEQQGKTPAASPEEEVAKLQTQAEADKAVANAPKPETNQTPVDPAEAKKPMTPQEAYELAKKANYAVKDGETPDPVKVAEAEAAKADLAKRLPELLAAQTEGRSATTDEGQALQTKRQAFEMALAHSPEVEAAIKPTLDLMCEKAFDYLAKMHGNDLGGAIGKLGVDPSSGLAGAVGTDANAMLDVLANGNVRERAIALGNFQQLLAKQALAGPNADGLDGIAQLRAAFGGDSKSSFGTADIDRLEAHVNALKDANGGKALTPKDAKALTMLSPEDGPHQAFNDARAEKHDTKMPSLSADAVQAQLGDNPVQAGTSLTGEGEKSALARTKMTLMQAIDAGIELSNHEIDAAVANGGVLPWNDGTVANILKPNAPFIADANNAAMPLKAGISGTTFRLMNNADVLGVDPAMARLIAMSQLIGINAHSFHEIASASQGFQGADNQYSPANPYTPASTGLSDAQLMAIMLRNGMLPSDLNQTVQPPPPTHESQ